MLLHWSSLLVFFGLAVLALWVCSTILQKNGLYFFGIVASIVSAYFCRVELIDKSFSVQMVVLPVIFLALLMAYVDYGKKESIRLFYIVLFSQITMFVLRFFEFAFLDMFAEIITKMAWINLKDYVATVIAFGVTCVVGYFIVENWKLNKIHRILRTSIYLAILTAINYLIFVVTAYSGYYSFVDIIIVYFLGLAFSLVMSLLLGCFEWLMFYFSEQNKDIREKAKANRKDNNQTNKKLANSNQNSKLDNSKKQQEKEKKLSNFFNKKDNSKKNENKKLDNKKNDSKPVSVNKDYKDNKSSLSLRNNTQDNKTISKTSVTAKSNSAQSSKSFTSGNIKR